MTHLLVPFTYLHFALTVVDLRFCAASVIEVEVLEMEVRVKLYRSILGNYSRILEQAPLLLSGSLAALSDTNKVYLALSTLLLNTNQIFSRLSRLIVNREKHTGSRYDENDKISASRTKTGCITC